MEPEKTSRLKICNNVMLHGYIRGFWVSLDLIREMKVDESLINAISPMILDWSQKKLEMNCFMPKRSSCQSWMILVLVVVLVTNWLVCFYPVAYRYVVNELMTRIKIAVYNSLRKSDPDRLWISFPPPPTIVFYVNHFLLV